MDGEVSGRGSVQLDQCESLLLSESEWQRADGNHGKMESACAEAV